MAPGTAIAPGQILASGVAMRWALEAQELLAEDWGVAADVWSATSWNELRRDALAARSGTCCTRTRSRRCRT